MPARTWLTCNYVESKCGKSFWKPIQNVKLGPEEFSSQWKVKVVVTLYRHLAQVLSHFFKFQ